MTPSNLRQIRPPRNPGAAPRTARLACGCALAVLAALGGPRAGAAETLLTLPAALRQAGQASLPADLAVQARIQAEQGSRAIQATYLPELKLQGGHLSLDQDPALVTAPIALGPFTVPAMAEPFAQKSTWAYQLKADYLVYDFGKRASALAAAQARAEAVDLGGRDEVRRAQAEAAARYLTVLDLKARRQVVAQRQQALADHLKDARSLLAQGLVARNDLLRAEVALRTVRDSATAVDNRLASAQESLNLALGLAPETRQTLPERLGPPPALPWDDAAIRARAEAGNDGVKALQAKVKAAEDQTAYRRRDFSPNLVASLEHDYVENRYLVHPQQTALFLGVSWKLFDGGVRSAHLSQARAEGDSARRQLLEAGRQAGNAAAQARRAFQEALQEMATAQANVTSAEENLRIVKEQYQQGYAKGSDVLDAETLLAESRFNLADRHYQAYGQQVTLLAVLGEDLAAFYAAHLEN
jgi:outer membrane protein TolC